MITKNEFGKKIMEILCEKMPDAEINIREVTKNNGLIRTGLSIRPNSVNVAPTVYIDGFYEEYCHGKSIWHCVEQILETYENNKMEQNIGLDSVLIWDNVKDKVGIYLVNTAKNAELLENIPHKEVLDLSVIYKISTDLPQTNSAETVTGTITVNNNIMERWGISVDELHKKARENSALNNPAVIKSMAETLAKLGMPAEMLEDAEIPMSVISNKNMSYGASAILYPEVLKNFCKKMHIQSVIIIPSSVHECILLHSEGYESEINLMIQEVNATQVAPDEVLSSHAYRYDAETDSFNVC